MRPWVLNVESNKTTRTLAISKGTDKCNDRCQPKRKCNANLAKPERDSAAGTHLMSSVTCGNSHNGDCFRILSKARSPGTFTNNVCRVSQKS